MRVLVYGAGVIGCFLAHTLVKAGNEVSLLARGEWKDNLERNGLIILHSLQKRTTTDHPQILGKLGDEKYDAVFAVMQHQQMGLILDDLARANSPLVVLVGNNMSAPEMEEYIKIHTAVPKTVLFGFQGTAGRREGGKVICARFGAGSMSIGRLNSEPSNAIKARVTALFSGTKYRLTWVPDMDTWYKCHVAFILPVAFLCYGMGCDLRKTSSLQRRQLVDGAIEGYKLLTELGYPVPPEEEEYYQPGIKRQMLVAMMFIMAKTAIGDLAASDHCRHAVTEMEGLDRAWSELRGKLPDFPMSNWDSLRDAMPDWETLHQIYG